MCNATWQNALDIFAMLSLFIFTFFTQSAYPRHSHWWLLNLFKPERKWKETQRARRATKEERDPNG